MEIEMQLHNGNPATVNGRGIARRSYDERVALAAGARMGEVAITNLSAREAAALFVVSSGDVERKLKSRAANGNGRAHTAQKRLAEIVAEIGVDEALSALAANEKRGAA
jgi:hypothetical protein